MTHVLNLDVDVTSFYFTNGKLFPRRVAFNNKDLVFIEDGLRCLVNKGQELVEIFNMSDGRDQYRLKFEPAAQHWTLLTKRALV